jgi:hypothetical protein
VTVRALHTRKLVGLRLRDISLFSWTYQCLKGLVMIIVARCPARCILWAVCTAPRRRRRMSPRSWSGEASYLFFAAMRLHSCCMQYQVIRCASLSASDKTLRLSVGGGLSSML